MWRLCNTPPSCAMNVKFISRSTIVKALDPATLTDDCIGYGDFQPHSVSDLQARVRQLHDLYYCRHVRL